MVHPEIGFTIWFCTLPIPESAGVAPDWQYNGSTLWPLLGITRCCGDARFDYQSSCDCPFILNCFFREWRGNVGRLQRLRTECGLIPHNLMCLNVQFYVEYLKYYM